MGQQVINIGATANDGTGDDLRSGGEKINENFNQVFGNFAQTADGSLIDTSTERSIIGSGVGSLLMPANTSRVGDSYHAKIGGVINATGGGNRSEIIIRVKSGATLLSTSGVFDLETATNEGWECEFDFTIRTIGATGTINTNGNFIYTKDGARQVHGFMFQDSEVINTTVDNTLDVTVEFNVLNTGDSIQAKNFVLRRTYTGLA